MADRTDGRHLLPPGRFRDTHADTAANRIRLRDEAEAREDLEARIRDHPLAAVVAAFAAGYLARRIL